jgi:SPP1 family predicted phage head-tail adaptor
MINSGQMREKVTIQRAVDQQSAFGEATIVWEDVATVSAAVMGVRAADYFAAQQAGQIVTHRIRIRFFPGLTHQHRLIWRDRVMEISSVLEREVRAIHEILAREDAT